MSKIKISPYIAFLASGSEISQPGAALRGSGYDLDLARELARVAGRGGIVDLSREGLLDLAEWLDAIGSAEGQSGNTSGATSCARLAERARTAAEGGA